jgi:RND family efflux transporter MFP subunit
MKNLLLSLAILCGIVTGCNNAPKKKAHKHGLEPINQTIYSDNFEVYFTSKPFVKGKENKLVVYVTDHSNKFSPYTESINVTYKENGNNTQNKKLSKSINNSYNLSITPSNDGNGTLIFLIGEDEIATDNFKIYTDEHSAEEVGHHDLGPTEVSYKKSQLWNINFATQVAIPTTFNEVTATSGEIKSAPGDEVIVSAKSSGIVVFSQEGMVIGKPISKGSGMFIISNSDISVDNIDTKFQQAKVSLELAKVNYERNQDLIKDQIISQKELLDSKAAYDNAQIDYNTHAKNYSKGGIKVSSSIQGYLKNLLVSEGQFVEVGMPLATISQNKKLLIEADITQKDFSKMKSFKSATFKMVGSDKLYHTDSLNGSILSIGTSINPEHPFIPISMEVDNVGDLISGAMVEVFLHAASIQNVLTLPRTALLEEQGIYSVFVQINGETFKKQEVQLGATDGKKIVILDGIKSGDRVVTQGVYQLKLAMSSGSLPAHSHEH